MIRLALLITATLILLAATALWALDLPLADGDPGWVGALYNTPPHR